MSSSPAALVCLESPRTLRSIHGSMARAVARSPVNHQCRTAHRIHRKLNAGMITRHELGTWLSTRSERSRLRAAWNQQCRLSRPSPRVARSTIASLCASPTQ